MQPLKATVRSWTSDKPQKQATAKAARATLSINTWLPVAELLVNVYNYCLMVKSVSCCCVRGRWHFSNLVTLILSLVKSQDQYTLIEQSLYCS